MIFVVVVMALVILALLIFIWRMSGMVKIDIKADDEDDEATPLKPSRYKDQVTPQDYHTIFESIPTGQAILSDLVSRFGGTSYVRGGHDADRETCFRAGQKHVVDHILIQTNRAIQIQQKQPEVDTDD